MKMGVSPNLRAGLLGQALAASWAFTLLNSWPLVAAAQTQPGASPSPPAASPTPDSGAPSPAAPAGEPLSRDAAVQLALRQASAYQQAALGERAAGLDGEIARAALLPRLSAQGIGTLSSPTLRGGSKRVPAFIAANAVPELQTYLTVSGEIDVSGALSATLAKNRALIDAAKAGTEMARRALVSGTELAYFGLAFAIATREAAELNAADAGELERVIGLMLKSVEVARFDLLRARIGSATRADELERARSAELGAASALRLLIGYDFDAPLAVERLESSEIHAEELEAFPTRNLSRSPELQQLDAMKHAADLELSIARAEGRPKLAYVANVGWDTDALSAHGLASHFGATAELNLNVPLLDWGAADDKYEQAALRAAAVQSQTVVAAQSRLQSYLTARQQAVSATRRIALLRTAVADAQQSLGMALARYRAGEGPILEVTDAQSTLASQRTGLFQAIFDYQIALTELRSNK